MHFKTCYLCGRNIDLTIKSPHPNSNTDDHIPPKQMCAKLPDQHKKNLITLPTHKRCNESYQNDENEFTQYITLLAGNLKDNNLIAQTRFTKMLKDYRKRPNNLELWSKIANTKKTIRIGDTIIPEPIYGKKIENTIWKIVRGLYFKKDKRVLTKETPHEIIPDNMPVILKPSQTQSKPIETMLHAEIYEPTQRRQIERAFKDLKSENQQSNTQHSELFDYRYKNLINKEIWELKFYTGIILIVRHTAQ